MTLRLIFAAMVALALSAPLLYVHAASLDSYLSTYVSNSAISGASFYAASYNGSNYTIMQLSGNNNYIVILNRSGAYSFVTNTTAIQGVLSPFLTNKYYPSNSTLSYLNATMRAYIASAAKNVSDCVQETGLATATCTTANNCESCQNVPVCRKVLNGVGGPSSPFGQGIMNFSIAYDRLNASFNSYFSTLSSINHSNAGTMLSELSSLAAAIPSIVSSLAQNPIFPAPPGTTFSNCNPAAPPSAQPWYCTAVGFCSNVQYKNALLSGIQSTLSSLESSIPSPSALSSISSNSSTSAKGYLNAYSNTRNSASYNSLIIAILPKINSILNSSAALLQRYGNSTLNASVRSLRSQLQLVESAKANQSIAAANATLNAMLANTIKAYASTNATYNQVYSTSKNNTESLLADQLSYQMVPTRLAILADEQQSINVKLDKGINSNDISAISPDVRNIAIESALFLSPLTPGYMIKLIDGQFITAMLAPYNTPIPQKLAEAPLYAAIESLIIGILVVIVLLIITYLRVIRKGKLKNNKRAKKMWIAVFVALILLAIAYTYMTYAYAANATGFLPFNYFMNDVKASGSVYIALNGSAASNASIAPCVSTIANYLRKASKGVQIIKLENYSCVSGSNVSVLGLNCYNNILSSNKPVIYISQSGASSIAYKGLYGTVLYASGSVAEGASCTLGTLFRNA